MGGNLPILSLLLMNFQEHSLGSDVPLKNLDRSVSSFAMQLKYKHGPKSTQSEPSHKVNDYGSAEQDCQDVYSLSKIEDEEFKNLENTFKDLGLCMMELGLHIARICDRAIGGEELVQSLLESCSAKGRLIHYHSILDGLIIKKMGRRKGSSKQRAKHKGEEMNEPTATEFSSLDKSNTGDAAARCDPSNLWQQWHYDYGIFTVLTAPLFIFPCHTQSTKAEDHFYKYGEQECPSPSGHTYLQIFDPNKNEVLMVNASPDSLIVQVGESADILSKGKLRSTLHSVCRPAKLENLSRETFVVFLQPAWSKTFSISDYPMDHSVITGQCAGEEPHKRTQEIHRIVPPLASRLKDGMTFAEFSRETTKQYYGGSGLQSKR